MGQPAQRRHAPPSSATLLTVALTISLSSSVSFAGDHPDTGEAAALSDQEVSARLDFLAGSLEHQKVYANIWWWGWTVGQLGAAVLFGTLAYTDRDEPGATANNAVSAVQALLGGTLLLLDPLDAAFVPRRVRELPDGTAQERRAKLAAAEEGLRAAAEWERFGRHWINHVMGFVMGALGWALLTEAFPDTDWRDGFINFAVAVGTTEIMIWTQPMRAVRDLERYEHSFGAADDAPEVSFGAGLGGAWMTVSF